MINGVSSMVICRVLPLRAKSPQNPRAGSSLRDHWWKIGRTERRNREDIAALKFAPAVPLVRAPPNTRDPAAESKITAKLPPPFHIRDEPVIVFTPTTPGGDAAATGKHDVTIKCARDDQRAARVNRGSMTTRGVGAETFSTWKIWDRQKASDGYKAAQATTMLACSKKQIRNTFIGVYRLAR